MNIKDKIVLITGAGGGIGACLVEEFFDRGAAKIYAADLNVDGLNKLKNKYENIVTLKLDVTQQDDINNSVAICADVDILINNAGVELASPVFAANSVKAAKLEMSVNCLGLHSLSVAFWDILKTKESCIMNMLSIASFVYIPNISTYCASKMAAHSITQAFRYASIGTSVKVVGIYPGYVDTNMIKDMDVIKATPQQLATNICNDFEKGIVDIFPDSMSMKLSKQAWHQNMTLGNHKK